MRPIPPPSSSSLTITNPLHLYRTHLATSRLLPDPHQHHAALILQSVYHRLLDYTPPAHLDTRLQSLARAISHANPNSPPTLRRFLPLPRSEERESRDLIRILTTSESALELDTPQGLLLSGEVGTGKSMLIDLLYHSLPTSLKQRWHFNAFLLHIFSSLEAMRRSSAPFSEENEYSILRLARDTVQQSPILFLDEFQLPDRASAKLVSGLLVGFWGMGGVLVGSSNRKAGELVKGAGTGREGEFDGFLKALDRRCELWNMGGNKDWRREERGGGWWKVGFGEVEGDRENIESENEAESKGPVYCFIENGKDVDKQWENVIRMAVSRNTKTIDKTDPQTSRYPEPQWGPATLSVYGRSLHIPKSSNGVALFSFTTLCGATLGPADYITLTSHYHTIFIDAIPTLTHSSLKSEARRFITLLDAIYESGVRLAIRIDAPSIDDLFFPDAVIPEPGNPNHIVEKGEWDMSGDADPLEAEVYAESHQDLTAPFRPNVALYEAGSGHGEVVPEEVDFSSLAAFTGEDEKFAFRRAVSRIWEVTGVGWWRGVEWRPSVVRRVWEGKGSAGAGNGDKVVSRAGVAVGEKCGRDGVVFSPFRRHAEPPPRFSVEHFWSVVRWGRRAGNWGKGVEGVEERQKEKEKGV